MASPQGQDHAVGISSANRSAVIAERMPEPPLPASAPLMRLCPSMQQASCQKLSRSTSGGVRPPVAKESP
jgi:hypothetical protein